MKHTLVTIVAAALSLVIGAYFGGKYIGKGESILLTCVMGEVAVKEGYITLDKYLSLSERTGAVISERYPIAGRVLMMSDAFIDSASKSSGCSQVLVSLTKGMK